MSAVFIDTCIWSLALRGKKTRDTEIAHILTKLIQANQVSIIGPIRQELLSGYSHYEHYVTLRDKLSYFPNEQLLDNDYIKAAEFSNTCRKKGIQGSHTDFLICAVAVRLNIAIYTTDNDFQHYKKHLAITLFTMDSL